MNFNDFFNDVKTKANELKTQALKFKNKEFLEAAMAGSALIAMADGKISSEEKQKMIKFIENHDALSIFTTSDVIKALKSNAEAGRLLIRMMIAIASSDGDFDLQEQAVAAKIAKELALNPAEFGL